MPTRPNALERLILFRLNRGPAPVLDLFGAASFEVVCLALDVGLFDALDGEEALSVGELAGRIDASAPGTRAVGNFLAAQGYLDREGDAPRYQLTPMTRRWLTDAEGTNLGPWFRFWNDLVFPFWEERLERAVREGEAPETIYEWLGDDRERWTVAQRGFRAAATVLVDEVVGAIDVPEEGRLLDVGGGHGLYAIELCRRHPGLSATVLDRPAALETAREEISAADLGDRVSARSGDYLRDDLGGEYDLALAFNVIHAHDAGTSTQLFERVAAALAPGGRIALLDQFEGTARTSLGETGIGFAGLTYFATLGASVHEYDAVADWLRDAGFEDVRRTAIRRAGPGNALVEATLSG